MLGKLIKHDFKSTGKVLVPVYLLLIAITLLGTILLGTRVLQKEEMIPFALVLLVTYILAIFAISIVTLIFLVVHYYRSMFSAQGYLTFTLPASSFSIFNSKLIVGFCWVTLNSILTYASIIILAGTACGFRALGSVFSDLFMGNMFIEAGAETGEFSISFLDLLGYTPAQAILLFVIMFLAACFYSVAVGFGSITIGQLYAKHKVVGAILTYIGIYFVVQIVMFISVFIISFRSVFDFMSSSIAVPADLEVTAFTDMMSSIYQPIFPTTTILYLVVGIICYVVSAIIVKKKVNLD